MQSYLSFFHLANLYCQKTISPKRQCSSSPDGNHSELCQTVNLTLGPLSLKSMTFTLCFAAIQFKSSYYHHQLTEKCPEIDPHHNPLQDQQPHAQRNKNIHLQHTITTNHSVTFFPKSQQTQILHPAFAFPHTPSDPVSPSKTHPKTYTLFTFRIRNKKTKGDKKSPTNPVTSHHHQQSRFLLPNFRITHANGPLFQKREGGRKRAEIHAGALSQDHRFSIKGRG
ncbi:hypothetical protein GGI43DRAFT_405029 [Trichoderma evansii]